MAITSIFASSCLQAKGHLYYLLRTVRQSSFAVHAEEARTSASVSLSRTDFLCPGVNCPVGNAAADTCLNLNNLELLDHYHEQLVDPPPASGPHRTFHEHDWESLRRPACSNPGFAYKGCVTLLTTFLFSEPKTPADTFTHGICFTVSWHFMPISCFKPSGSFFKFSAVGSHQGWGPWAMPAGTGRRVGK